MPLTRLVSDRMKTLLRPPLNRFRRCFPWIAHRHKSLQKTHAYWRNPRDGANLPANYLRRDDRSRFLLDLVNRYVKPDARLLEIGCNVGRNLNCLYVNGLKNLTGVEINGEALDLLATTFPAMVHEISLVRGPIEKLIPKFRPGEFDLTFTMAVLEHIHVESEWIFAEITRITRECLITIEDERGRSWRHFPRNYCRVFENLGMKQVEEIRFGEDGLDVFSADFHARVFRHI